MKVRPAIHLDLPVLHAMAEASEFPYPELSEARLASCYVVVDDQDRPIMACAAEQILQLYLFVGDVDGAAAKLHAIRLLHDAMAADLKEKGYREVNAFLPPSIARKFGRRLERSFGWVRNWASWAKGF